MPNASRDPPDRVSASLTSASPRDINAAVSRICASKSDSTFDASSAARPLSSASFRTSSATTANPRPSCPARAASIAALSARRFVWTASSRITEMSPVTCPVACARRPTRCEPSEQVDIVRNAWSSALDPRIAPQDKLAGITSHSKLILEACRPFRWRDSFPPISALSLAEARAIEAKWGEALKGAP